jgi:hypothetical protein
LATGVRDWDELAEQDHKVVQRFPKLV